MARGGRLLRRRGGEAEVAGRVAGRDRLDRLDGRRGLVASDVGPSRMEEELQEAREASAQLKEKRREQEKVGRTRSFQLPSLVRSTTLPELDWRESCDGCRLTAAEPLERWAYGCAKPGAESCSSVGERDRRAACASAGADLDDARREVGEPCCDEPRERDRSGAVEATGRSSRALIGEPLASRRCSSSARLRRAADAVDSGVETLVGALVAGPDGAEGAGRAGV